MYIFMVIMRIYHNFTITTIEKQGTNRKIRITDSHSRDIKKVLNPFISKVFNTFL